MKVFLQTAEDWWGTHLARGQLEKVGLVNNLDPQPYLDNKQMDKTFSTLKEKVTPEAGDEYIQASHATMLQHFHLRDNCQLQA